jgi:hypothetical protein
MEVIMSKFNKEKVIAAIEEGYNSRSVNHLVKRHNEAYDQRIWRTVVTTMIITLLFGGTGYWLSASSSMGVSEEDGFSIGGWILFTVAAFPLSIFFAYIVSSLERWMEEHRSLRKEVEAYQRGIEAAVEAVENMK